MAESKKISRLSLLLIGAVALSFAAAFGFYYFFEYAMDSFMIERLNDESFIDSRNDKIADKFRQFVEGNKISLYDRDSLNKWETDMKYVSLTVYLSTDNGFEMKYPWSGDDAYVVDEEEMKNEKGKLFSVEFADGIGECIIYTYYVYLYYDVALRINFALSCLMFLIIFILLIRRKIRYINGLADDIRILEGGELDHPVSVRGTDEISVLARGIDDMRLSFIARLQSEDEARRANRELITAMSHDLRTPLTTQIGYLDIINSGKCSDEATLLSYVSRAREKAYEIKDLSDKLFEYFLAFDSSEREVELQRFEDGNGLLDQIIGEHIFWLEDGGYDVIYEPAEFAFSLDTNVNYINRIFNNIFSNIVKYGDKDMPVIIRQTLEGNMLLTEFINGIAKETGRTERNEIGLKSSARMASELGGSMHCKRQGEKFVLRLAVAVRRY